MAADTGSTDVTGGPEETPAAQSHRELVNERIKKLLEVNGTWTPDHVAEYGVLMSYKAMQSFEPTGDLSKFVTHDQLEATILDLKKGL